MKKLYNLALLLVLPLVTVSCIRDELEDCPPLSLTIKVKDKNYFNVDMVNLETRKSEDLPFKEYVPTLHYSLTDVETNEVMFHTDFETVRGDNKEINVELPSWLPFGTYAVQVWGGLGNIDPIGDDHTTIDFHPGNNQGQDVYLTTDTIVYSPTIHAHSVELERTKGKLIIQLENLPDGMEYSEKTVNNLFSSVSSDFSYSGETFVKTSSHWTGNSTVTKTILTPSFNNRGSKLEMVIHDGSLLDDNIANNQLEPYNISVMLNRNELTVVRYTWNDQQKDFAIYLLVNGNWECIHGLEVE